MMDQKTLKTAVDEAKRFLKRAKDMHVHEDNFGGYHSGKESGALLIMPRSLPKNRNTSTHRAQTTASRPSTAPRGMAVISGPNSVCISAWMVSCTKGSVTATSATTPAAKAMTP